MKLMACYLFLLSIVTFELVSSFSSISTSSPNNNEVPSTHMPHILTNATEITVIEGQNVTFQCSVDELGVFVISWLKNKEPYFADNIKIKKDDRFSLLSDKSIHIQNVHANDAAEYICQISTNPKLEVRHTLIVKGAPIAKTTPESGLLTVRLGEPIAIGCDASGDPLPVITWTHSMKKVTKNIEGGNIFIPVANKEHAGIYECKVDNGVDIPSLGKIEVNVHYEPTIETPTKIIYTGEGAGAEILCTVFGEPSPKVTWLKDNSRITFPQDNLKTYRDIHTHRLMIRKVTRSDLGNYTCKAANSLGHAVQTIEVTGVPAPVKFKNRINDRKPDSYAMEWSVASHSPVNEFKLKFRKKPVNGEEEYEWTEVYIPAEKHTGLFQTHTYDITGLEPACMYEAIILTRNKFGWNNRSEIFIFTTEGAGPLVSDIEEPKQTENGNNESRENMVITNEVTSSSIAETRTNEDDKNNAERFYWSSYMVTVACMVVMFLW